MPKADVALWESELRDLQDQFHAAERELHAIRVILFFCPVDARQEMHTRRPERSDQAKMILGQAEPFIEIWLKSRGRPFSPEQLARLDDLARYSGQLLEAIPSERLGSPLTYCESVRSDSDLIRWLLLLFDIAEQKRENSSLKAKETRLGGNWYQMLHDATFGTTLYEPSDLWRLEFPNVWRSSRLVIDALLSPQCTYQKYERHHLGLTANQGKRIVGRAGDAYRGREAQLSPAVWSIFYCLLQSADRGATSEELLQEYSGNPAGDPNDALRVAISSLRTQLIPLGISISRPEKGRRRLIELVI